MIAGGHLLPENGVKKQALSEPQASSAALAHENWMVAERSGAQRIFATFVAKQIEDSPNTAKNFKAVR